MSVGKRIFITGDLDKKFTECILIKRGRRVSLTIEIIYMRNVHSNKKKTVT